METTQLEARVARLESSARRWRMAAVGLGCLLAGMVVAGAGAARSAPTEVRVMNWNEMAGDNGAFFADGTLRTRNGKTPLATRIDGGTLSTVETVRTVEQPVTTTGRHIPGLPGR